MLSFISQRNILTKDVLQQLVIIFVHKMLYLFIDFSSLCFFYGRSLMLSHSFSLAKVFMEEALQGFAVICPVCKFLHLFMDLSCNSWMRARRGFFVFDFIHLCVGDLLSHFQVSQYENVQDNVNVSCTPLICHLKGQIWGKEPARRVSRWIFQHWARGQALPQKWQFWASVWKSLLLPFSLYYLSSHDATTAWRREKRAWEGNVHSSKCLAKENGNHGHWDLFCWINKNAKHKYACPPTCLCSVSVFWLPVWVLFVLFDLVIMSCHHVDMTGYDMMAVQWPFTSSWWYSKDRHYLEYLYNM